MKEKDLICEVVLDLFPLYVEEIAGPESVQLIEEHIQSCSGCRNCLEDMKKNGDISPEKKAKIIAKSAGSEIRGIFAEALSRISDVVRFVPLVVYIIALFAWIDMECWGIKYPHVRFDNWSGILCMFAYEIVIPCAFLLFIFWKNAKVWKKIATLVVCVICSWYLICMSVAGMLASGNVLCNYTDDVSDYREVIASTQMDGEYAILPEKIPAGSEDVTFEYESLNTWDIAYRYELKLRFTDRDVFEEELERLQTSEYKRNMYGATKEGEIHFALIYGSEKAVCYFDKDTMEMYYIVSRGEY